MVLFNSRISSSLLHKLQPIAISTVCTKGTVLLLVQPLDVISTDWAYSQDVWMSYSTMHFFQYIFAYWAHRTLYETNCEVYQACGLVCAKFTGRVKSRRKSCSTIIWRFTVVSYSAYALVITLTVPLQLEAYTNAIILHHLVQLTYSTVWYWSCCHQYRAAMHHLYSWKVLEEPKVVQQRAGSHHQQCDPYWLLHAREEEWKKNYKYYHKR